MKGKLNISRVGDMAQLAGCDLGANGQKYKTPAMEAELSIRMLDLHVQRNHAPLGHQGVGETGPSYNVLLFQRTARRIGNNDVEGGDRVPPAPLGL